LWSGRPAQSSQRRQPYFQIAVAQAFGQRGDAFEWRAFVPSATSARMRRQPAVIRASKIRFFDEPAFPAEISATARILLLLPLRAQSSAMVSTIRRSKEF